LVRSTTAVSGAVKIAVCVHHQVFVQRVFAVGRSTEAVHDSFLTGFVNFEDRSKLESSALIGYAIEVATCIPDQASGGKCTIVTPLKVVKHGQLAGPIQHEHVSERRSSVNEPARSRAEEIARSIPSQTSIWISSVRSAGEAVQNGVLTGLVDLEHGSATRSYIGVASGRAAVDRGSVEIASAVSNQRSLERASPVAIALKRMEHSVSLRLYRARHDERCHKRGHKRQRCPLS